MIADELKIKKGAFKYLALGDSYTIGEAVDADQSFPIQLEKKLEKELKIKVKTKIIATTGWRTDQLIKAIIDNKLKNEFDFITLLIGVNNQFQEKDFNQYEKEFIQLLEIATKLVNGFQDKILVLSIPDYAFTPFGKEKKEISEGVDKYNSFAKKAAYAKKIKFLNITDITRRGIKEPNLVAMDDLHISEIVYKEITERIFKEKFEKRITLK